MPTRRSIGQGLMAACALGACSARQAPATELPDEGLGRYGFVAEASEGRRMTGILSVTRDTIVVQPDGTSCRVAKEQANSSHLVYECLFPGTAGLHLSIDRRSPVRRSTWAVFLPIRRVRDVCILYRTWENGTRTCTQYIPEEYIEQVRRTGPLVVTR